MYRQSHHHNSSSMGSILAPEAHKPLPKNYHKDNINKIQQREIEI